MEEPKLPTASEGSTGPLLPQKVKIRLASSMRLSLVDADEPDNLLGCVFCGPAFIARAGDCPSALMFGLDLDPKLALKLRIFSLNSSEVTMGLRKSDFDASQYDIKSIFDSEPRVVFLERFRSDPDVASLEGLALLLVDEEDFEKLKETTTASALKSRTTKAPSAIPIQAPLSGVFRENSNKSASLQQQQNSQTNLAKQPSTRRSTMGKGTTGATAAELVAEAQSSGTKAYKFRYVYIRKDQARIYWYESRARYLADASDILGYLELCELVAIRQSTKAFVFDNLANVTSVEFVLRAGQPIVMSLGFPFPLVQWLYTIHASLRLPRMSVQLTHARDEIAPSWSLILATPSGPGFPLNHPLILEHHTWTCSQHKLGFSIMSGSGGTILDQVCGMNDWLLSVETPDYAPPSRDATSTEERNPPSAAPATARSMTNRLWDLFAAPATPGTSPSPSSPASASAIASSLARTKGFSFSSLRSRQFSNSKRPSMGLRLPGSRRGTGQSTRNKSVTFSDTVTHMEQPSDNFSGGVLRPGDLLVKVESRWAMDLAWRDSLDLLTATNYRPLVLTFARVATLEDLSKDSTIVHASQDVQSALWDAQVSPAVTKTIFDETSQDKIKSMDASKLSPVADLLKIVRRRAATRQLLKRQTARMLHVPTVQPGGVVTVPKDTTASEPQSMRAGSSSVSAVTTHQQQRSSADLSSEVTNADTISPRSRRSKGLWSLPSALAKAKHTPPAGSRISTKSASGFLTSASASTSPPISPANALTKVLAQLTAVKPMKVKEEALGLLLALTSDKMNHAFCGPQCIPVLVSLMDVSASSSPLVLERCAGCLWNLSDHEPNAILVGQHGGVQALTRILVSSDDRLEYCKEEACGCLWSVMDDEANVPLVILSGATEPLVELLLAPTTSDFLKENILGCLWQLTSVAGGRGLVLQHGTMLSSLLNMILNESLSNICKENLMGILANLLQDPETKQRVVSDLTASNSSSPMTASTTLGGASSSATIASSSALPMPPEKESSGHITSPPAGWVLDASAMQVDPTNEKRKPDEHDYGGWTINSFQKALAWAEIKSRSVFSTVSMTHLDKTAPSMTLAQLKSVDNVPPATNSVFAHDDVEETKGRDTTLGTDFGEDDVSKEKEESLLSRRLRKRQPNLLQKLVQTIMFGHSALLKENAVLCVIELSRSEPQIAFKMCQEEAALTALLKLLLLDSSSEELKIIAAQAVHLLVELDARNRQQLAALGSVPELLRLLEHATKTREERHRMSAQVRTVIVRDPSVGVVEDLPSSLTGFAKGKYAHFDSVLLDSGLGEVVSHAKAAVGDATSSAG